MLQYGYEYLSIYPFVSDYYTFFQVLMKIYKYITGDNMLNIVIHILTLNIFNICIRCIWLNSMDIIPNFYRTIL